MVKILPTLRLIPTQVNDEDSHQRDGKQKGRQWLPEKSRRTSQTENVIHCISVTPEIENTIEFKRPATSTVYDTQIPIH